jgi:hypothetical protein
MKPSDILILKDAKQSSVNCIDLDLIVHLTNLVCSVRFHKTA